ncbi:hypothetical protein RKD49_000865 [Streptomyces glaucescens]
MDCDPTSAAAPVPMTITSRQNVVTVPTAHDMERRTAGTSWAEYRRMVMWGRQATPRTTVIWNPMKSSRSPAEVPS